MGKYKKLVDGVLVDMTTEECAARDAEMEAAESEAIAQIPAILAAHRYAAEIGGTNVFGVDVATDRDTQAKLIAVRIMAVEDEDFTVRWKLAPGNFVTLDAPDIIQLANAVMAHVQACFEAESQIVDGIGAYTDPAAVKAAFDDALAAIKAA